MKKLKYLFFLLTVLLSSCSEQWVLTNSGNCYIYTNSNDFIDWDGYIVTAGDFSVPLGKGIYSHTINKEIVHDEYIFNYSLSNSDYSQISYEAPEEYYIGEFKRFFTKKIPEGRGILYRNHSEDDFSCYIGHFSKGAPNGICWRYDNGKKVYHGEYKNGHADGYGCLYINDILSYEGYFSNGLRNGEGKEYGNTYILYGTWKEDKKNGDFIIKRNNNGTATHVNFINDVPDLSSGKVIYSNGFTWEGPLSTKYEPEGTGTLFHNDLQNEQEIHNGKLTGSQTLMFENGAIYEGETKNSKINGYGVLTLADEIIYDGYWENNKKNGYGELIFKDSWQYRGDFSNDLFDGIGTFETKNSYYEGSWKKGKKDGDGYLVFIKDNEEVFYNGSFKNDLFFGNGLLQFEDGSYYEGNWEKGKRNGFGEYQWKNGDNYKGNWSDDFPHGKGIITFSDGNYYDGEFDEGIITGTGTFHYSNGDKYEGTFVNNQRDGIGIYYYNSGEMYEGEFSQNNTSGKGKLFFTDNSYYEGNFSEGKISGEGSLFIPAENNSSYDIIYSKEWKGNINPSEVVIYFSNGDSFEGDFSNGTIGSGVWLSKEDRINNRTKTQQLNDFYDLHKESINKIVRTTQFILVSIDGLSTAISENTTGEISVISGAIANLSGFLSATIAISDMTVKTIDVVYDTKQIENAERVDELWKEYEKDMIYDVSFLAVTGALKVSREVNRNQILKNAAKNYSTVSTTQNSISNIGKTTVEARAVKNYGAKDTFIRTIVKLNYGSKANNLIKQYGDDAAKMLFKFGDHAIVPLQKCGPEVIKIYNQLGSNAMLPIFNYGEDAIKLLSSNMSSGTSVAKFINDYGNNGIKYMFAAGENAGRFADLYSKYDKEFIEVANRFGSNKINLLCSIAEKTGSDGLKILKQVPKSEFSRYSNYLNVTGSNGIKYLQSNGDTLPSSISQQIIRDAAKNDDILKVISGTYSNNNNVITMLKHNDRYADISKQLLKPNSCYRTGEGNYYYLTDDKGRITKAIAIQLRSKTDFGRTERLAHNSASLGKLAKDDAGHLFGDQFGGSPQLDNIISQSGTLNKGEYKNMEKYWADCLRMGKKFSATIDIKYDGDSLRPSILSVKDSIGAGHFYSYIN